MLTTREPRVKFIHEVKACQRFRLPQGITVFTKINETYYFDPDTSEAKRVASLQFGINTAVEVVDHA